MPDDTFLMPAIESELRFEFQRASGPGGQNVNKVATAALLRFDAAHSPSLTPDVRRRLLGLAGKAATREGEILILARRFRTQEQNREDAVKRLAALIHRASLPPKQRKHTKPTLSSKRKRLEGKRLAGKKKNLRRKPKAEMD